MAIVHEMAHRRARRAEIAERFPGRTIAAVKTKIHKVRHSMGLTVPNLPSQFIETSPTMLDRDDPGLRSTWPERFAKRAARSNELYLAALKMAA